jgi:hypothetical protein
MAIFQETYMKYTESNWNTVAGTFFADAAVLYFLGGSKFVCQHSVQGHLLSGQTDGPVSHNRL